MKNTNTVSLGVMAMLGWFLTFGFGLLITSQPYREQLLKAFDWQTFLCVLFTYTPTNIAVLCLLAAFCGGCTSRLIISEAVSALGAAPPNPGSPASDTQIYMRESPVNSMLRGFVVYVAFLAGVYVTSNAPFAAPTQEQYARAAGTISLVSFVIGYDPTFFRALISIGAKLKKD